jgi:F-type H+-transporting ATPase subunit b
MEKYLNFVTVDVWTMIFTWGNLIILLCLMKKFLFKPVKNIIEKREREIAQMYENAEKAASEASEMKLSYEKSLAQAKNEAGEIVKNATITAHKTEEQIISDAQARADAMISKAQAQIEADRIKTIETVKSDISGMAVDIASKVIEKDIDEKDHRRLIDKFISELGDAS